MSQLCKLFSIHRSLNTILFVIASNFRTLHVCTIRFTFLNALFAVRRSSPACLRLLYLQQLWWMVLLLMLWPLLIWLNSIVFRCMPPKRPLKPPAAATNAIIRDTLLICIDSNTHARWFHLSIITARAAGLIPLVAEYFGVSFHSNVVDFNYKRVFIKPVPGSLEELCTTVSFNLGFPSGLSVVITV